MTRTRLLAGAARRSAGAWRLQGGGAQLPAARAADDQRLPDEGRCGDRRPRGSAPTRAPAGAWWKAFGSADLDQVMDQALAGNQTVAAGQRLAGARCASSPLAAHGAQQPQVDLNANIAGERINIAVAAASPASPTRRSASIRWALNVNYDVDLFGGLRRTTEAARGPGREPGPPGRRRLSDADRPDRHRGAADRHHARRDRRRRAGGRRRPQADRHGARRPKARAARRRRRPSASRSQLAQDEAVMPPLRAAADAGAPRAGPAGRPGAGRLDRAGFRPRRLRRARRGAGEPALGRWCAAARTSWRPRPTCTWRPPRSASPPRRSIRTSSSPPTSPRPRIPPANLFTYGASGWTLARRPHPADLQRRQAEGPEARGDGAGQRRSTPTTAARCWPPSPRSPT